MNGVSRQDSAEETAAGRDATRPGCDGYMRAATGYWNVRSGEQHRRERECAGWGDELV